MDDYLKKVHEAACYIKARMDIQPVIGIVLGSGLGSLVDKLSDPIEMDYADIPYFPETTVAGHAGKLASGLLGGRQALVMKGRFHYYEGCDISQVVFHIRVFKLLGIGSLMVTNAAGGINGRFKPGDLMIITDHIGFFAPSPLRGKNMEEFGVRFPDMCGVYDLQLQECAVKAALETGIDIKKGVYAFTQGPKYETPAEIKALGMLGADAAGMSTVPEVITARHSGMKVLGISLITNMAAGVYIKPPDHKEVVEAALRAEPEFVTLVTKIVEKWGEYK